MEVVGFEPTTFLMWRIYSPLPSTNSAHTSIICNTLRYAFRQRHGLNEECILKHTNEIALPQFHAELLVVTEALSSCE